MAMSVDSDLRRTIELRLGILAVLGGLLSASSAAQTSSQPTEATARYAFNVHIYEGDPFENLRVFGAKVEVLSAVHSARVGYTDINGFFDAGRLEPGGRLIVISHPEFRSREYVVFIDSDAELQASLTARIAPPSEPPLRGETESFLWVLPIAVVIASALIIVPRIHTVRIPDLVARIQTENAVRQTLAQVVTGVIIVAGLYFTAEEFRETQQKNRIDRRLSLIADAESRRAAVRTRMILAAVGLEAKTPIQRMTAIDELRAVAKLPESAADRQFISSVLQQACELLPTTAHAERRMIAVAIEDASVPGFVNQSSCALPPPQSPK